MNQWIRRKTVVGGLVAGVVGVFVAIALSLTLVLDGETNDTNEPLKTSTIAKLQSGHLKFIADTGRVIVNEDGVREIVWDPPQLPTLQESINKRAEAMAAGNPDLLPLCTEEYLQHLKEQKEAAGIRNEPTDHTFPACNAIPDAIYEGGLPGLPALTTDDPDHTGYAYVDDNKEGISGGITVVDPSLQSGELASARLLAYVVDSNDRYWLEAGWTEYPDYFGSGQYVYTQSCDDTEDSCDWFQFNNVCSHTSNVSVTVSSGTIDQRWDSYCYDYDDNEWITMWSNADLGDDDADVLEAYFEVREDRSGTIPMDSVTFYDLELRGGVAWDQWDDDYDSDTEINEEGGYTVTTNSEYYDFDVNN